MFVNGSGQNEQSLERTFHKCFLPSFTCFGWGVSEEKIKIWKVNGRQTTDAKWWQKLTLPLARWANNSLWWGQYMFLLTSLLSLSRTRLTRICGWVEFLSKFRTSLCINIYNFTPVESNSDESKFRLSRIKVLVLRCRKPYYLHSLSRIYLSKHVYYFGIKIGSHFYLRLFHMFISQSVKLISDNIWIALVLWHRLDVYNEKLSIHNKCAWVGKHQWLWKVHNGSVLSIELFVGNQFWLKKMYNFSILRDLKKCYSYLTVVIKGEILRCWF
jgi:hypothetical protein